jgi:hypothetical protein
MKAAGRAIGTFVLSLLLIAGCSAITPGGNGPTAEPSAVPTSSEPTQRPHETAEATEPANETPIGTKRPTGPGCELNTMSVEYLTSYTIGQLVGYGFAFAYGTAGDPGEPFFNTADGRKPKAFGPADPDASPGESGMIYTPYPLDVERVLGGDLQPGRQQVYLEGGSVDCITLAVDGNPYLPIGSAAVFVLSPAHDDAGKPLGHHMKVNFVWRLQEGKYLTGAGSFTLEELAAEIKAASRQ